MRDSPKFYVKFDDCADITARHLTLKTDTAAQKALLKAAGHWDSGSDLPVFPLNTDGIDPKATRVHIHDVTVDNYDDAVAVKPCNSDDSVCAPCASDVLVERVAVKNGVGLSVGSVHPSIHSNCVANVTFRDSTFEMPYKARAVTLRSARHREAKRGHF